MTPPKLEMRFDSDKLIEDEKSVEEDRALDAAGVENIADHGTIGPRKFFMLAERKKERKKNGERKKRRERKKSRKRKEKRKEKESKERESNCTNK